MGHPENVVVVKSEGVKCLWCDLEIAKGVPCVQIGFAVKGPLGIGLGTHREYACGACAMDAGQCFYRAGVSIVGPGPTYNRDRKSSG